MLTDVAVKAAKPGPKLKKLSDGGGLQLWLYPDGAKRWRLSYRFAGKQKSLAGGVYPATGIKEAREFRENARRALASGRGPSVEKKVAKATKAISSANTFGVIADELLHKKGKEGRAARTLVKVEWLLELAKPALGDRPISRRSHYDLHDGRPRLHAKRATQMSLENRLARLENSRFNTEDSWLDELTRDELKVLMLLILREKDRRGVLSDHSELEKLEEEFRGRYGFVRETADRIFPIIERGMRDVGYVEE